MVNAKADLHQNSILQIKQDDKFFCRLLSKETSMSNPSFRVPVSVPFVWESQPGTPKYTFSKDTLPPLTPPPSYLLSTGKKPAKKSRTNLLLALLPKLNLKKMFLSSSSSSSSSLPLSLESSCSSWSLSSSDSSKVVPVGKIGRRFLSYDSSFDFKGENEKDEGDSPTSTLCFGIPRANTSSNSGFQSKEYISP
ncbi:unnamed protein product [Lupinus luteus]|uniref:Uncharacterized protein n=1 Tax=Lupinus luteus TaxID=3873 RepID=A0AAV1WAY2_LUPLU